MIIPINLYHLLILLLFICSVKLNRSSNISPRCFWDWQVLISVLLKVKGRQLLVSVFFWRKSLLLLVFLGQVWIAFSTEMPSHLPFINHNSVHLAKCLYQEHLVNILSSSILISSMPLLRFDFSFLIRTRLRCCKHFWDVNRIKRHSLLARDWSCERESGF